ncbi:helix-turn-helix domain-containing protein [Azospirillum tabaci]|uniref:helix-turn-helix domain-containing protein n=1 Tax=Azospirillum tabaci TaxID=2752310 RepID=UPI001B3B5720|nr:helix-turn-helix domain-containing protein [Azospirillum tabaci]
MADSENTTPLPGAGRRKSSGALVPTKPADLPPLTPDQLNDQDGEPRVSDVILAERLGFGQPCDIRKLIERNRAELETYGEVCATVAQTTEKGGRPGKAYYLNEGQALVICALSRTPQAALVRRQIIEVFLAYRRGKLASPEGAALAALAAEVGRLAAVVGELVAGAAKPVQIAAAKPKALTGSKVRIRATDKSDSDLLYGVPAIAKHLNIRPRQAYHLIDKAELPAFKLSGKVCARQRDLAKWLDGKAVAHA